MTGLRTLAEWLDDIAALAEVLRTRFGVRFVLFSGLPPMHAFPAFPHPLRWYLGRKARAFDAALGGWAGRQVDCEHVALILPTGPDLFAVDGMHPGPRAYQLWSAELAERIRARFGEAATREHILRSGGP